jgi:hypothetical protein
MADRVILRFGSPTNVAWVRGLRGEDEDAIDARAGTSAALALLDRLLTPDSEGHKPAASDITTADRDRLLVAVYARTFGSRITSTVRCVQCEGPFEVDFSLKDMRRDLDAASAGLAADGTVALPDGRRYRLPTGRDEVDAQSSMDPVAALLRACAVDTVGPDDAGVVPNLMRAAAPTLDADLAACCPECGAEQTIRFDVQSYLLASLAADETQLVREVHRLATAYGWSRAEILAMTREKRRAHVAHIDGETRLRRRLRM